MRAFIVRPFGIKPDKQGRTVDFDAVERELIAPVLQQLGITGRTTGEIAAAGNIREDMFRMLVAADLVIADISIHNANAFYELGIRHALRPRRTFMIRCRADEPVFDLATDRYLEYDRDRPADGRPALLEGLRQTLGNERTDSPVFLLLPSLPAPSYDQLLPVPLDFREAVDLACGQAPPRRPQAAGRRGPRLRVGERGPPPHRSCPVQVRGLRRRTRNLGGRPRGRRRHGSRGQPAPGDDL